MSNETAGSLEDIFGSTIEVLNAFGGRFARECKTLDGLRERLQGGRFHLAVLGQFKRGKSTFLNALVGDELLPVSTLPLTAIPTFIEAGTNLGAEAIDHNGMKVDWFSGASTRDLHAFLSRVVTEEANPENRMGISRVDVRHPSPLLSSGVVLIDTPGIGSTFTHNTEVTLNFLAQCDTALFLISADPPMSEVELTFLKRVRELVPRLIFVLNKIDYLNDAQKNEVISFFEKTLREKGGVEGDIAVFPVSAIQGLRSQQAGDMKGWEASGMGDVKRYLVDFLAKEKSTLLHRAITIKVADVLSSILMGTQLTIQSLHMPLDELERRLEAFKKIIAETEHQRVVVDDLLAGERKRLLLFLEEQAALLRKKGYDHFRHILEEILKNPVTIDEARKELLEEIPLFFERELARMSRVFESKVAENLKPYQEQADGIIERIRKSAADLFETSYRAPESSEAFQMARQPYWSTSVRSSFMNPFPEGLLYGMLPGALRIRRMKKYLAEEVELLIFQNVENLRWTTLQNLNQALRRFSLDLAQHRNDTVAATEGAIAEAARKRMEQADQVSRELERYEHLKKLVENCLKRLTVPDQVHKDPSRS